MPEETAMAKDGVDYASNLSLDSRHSDYNVNDYTRPTSDSYSDRYGQYPSQQQQQQQQGRRRESEASVYTTQSLAYSSHNTYNEYDNYSNPLHSRNNQHTTHQRSASHAASYPSLYSSNYTNHTQGRPWSLQSSTTTNATTTNTDNDSCSIQYTMQSTSAAYATTTTAVTAAPLPNTSSGVHRRSIREPPHYPDRFNSRYSVASLQQLHDVHENDMDINRRSTVSPPVSTVAFSQVSNAFPAYNTHSPTDMNSESVTNNQYYQYNQPNQVDTNYRSDTEQTSTSTVYSQPYHTRPTNNSNHHQVYHRRITSSGQLSNSVSIPSSIATSSTSSKSRHMSQDEIHRPFSPISLDIIDNQLLRNASQSKSHNSERPSSTTSMVYSAHNSTQSMNRIECLPRHPSSSSSSASSRPSTVFVQSIVGTPTSNVPPAFPLISRSDKPTIASPVLNPAQRTLETNIDAAVDDIRQTTNDDKKTSIPISTSEGPAISTLLIARPTSRNGKFSLSMRFDRAFFCAGGLVTGRIEIQCQSSSIRIGEVSIEAIGIEEITSDSISNNRFNDGRRRLFYRARTLLQDADSPCDAAIRSLPPDRDGYWQARKTTTILPFAFSLSDKLPSSFRSKVGSIRYMVACVAQVCASGNRSEVIAHTRSVHIYERWSSEEVKLARVERVRAEARKRAFLGGDGHLSCIAETTRRLVSTGGIVYVRLGVRNHTRKRVSKIRFSLWHRVTTKRDAFVEGELSQQTQSVLDSNSRLVAERTYKGDDWQFDPEEEREVTLALTIPHDSISLRNTTLLRVSHILQVALHMHLSKDLTVELPIYVTHPASWSDLTPEGNDETDNDANREFARKVERSVRKVYSTYYGAQGIELDANVELPITPEGASLASTDGSEGITLKPQLSDPTPDSRTGPTSLNQGITGWTTNNNVIVENDNVDSEDDILTRLPVKPWTTNAATATGNGGRDATGTPVSTLGRGLLPHSLHVVNPDQSLNLEAEFIQDTIIAQRHLQNDLSAKEHPSLSSMNSDIII